MSRFNPASKKRGTETAGLLIPPKADIGRLAELAKDCTACPLFARGTQTVFGEGPQSAKIMFVGEQPGDAEDLAGRPFVGPAGRLLDRALDAAGIDRSRTYVTNAVKHFKWVPRGKRRIHSKPNSMEIQACFPWLEAEIAAVKPQVIVVLGATAAQALLGRSFRVTKQRGVPLPSQFAAHIVATVHPSALLRAPDEATRRAEIERFIDDLRVAANLLKR
jgi:uracil-DNA glycosylase family protein